MSLNPNISTPPSDRWLKIVGLLALGSVPTVTIVVTLSAIGLSLSLSGPVVFAAGVAKSLGYLPWVMLDCPPWVAIAFGPALSVLGIAAVWGLVAYLKLLARIVRRVLPTHQPA